MNKEEITKSKAQIKNKWFETREDELDIALNVIDDLLVYIIQLEEQLEHYKVKETERLTENLLQARNDCLEGYIKANMCGDNNE